MESGKAGKDGKSKQEREREIRETNSTAKRIDECAIRTGAELDALADHLSTRVESV